MYISVCVCVCVCVCARKSERMCVNVGVKEMGVHQL